MAFGNRPVASLRQRAVYKTEFDIFKQNTDIDLISLVSYEENDSNRLENKSRREPSYRKNFELINRNNTRIAYDPNNKFSRTASCVRQDREFKPNIWNKGDTTIYKAFARTSKTFLRNRTNGRKLERSRSCYSAAEVHKPLTETQNRVRCQSTCSNRTNERNWIKGAKINKPDVSNIETREATVNRNVNINKRSVSTNRTLCRTKSAPITSPTKCYIHNQTQERSGYLNRGKSAKTLTQSDRNQAEIKTSVEQNRTRVLTEKDTGINSPRVRNQGLTREQTVSYIEDEHRDTEISKANVTIVSEECKSDNQLQKERDREIENNSDKQPDYFDVKSDNCLTERNSDILDIENNRNSTELVIVTDDSPESKDSGFASNTITPELESRTVNTECEEQIEQPRKQVKFACEGTEDSENASLDAFSAVSDSGLSDRISVSSNESGKEVDDNTTTYDVNTLINDLERFGANSRLSAVSGGCHSIYSHDHDDSLYGENASRLVLESKQTEEETEVGDNEDSQQLDSAVSDLESLNMSREARHAILETLHDMGVKKPDKRNKENDLRDIKHKSVNVQRKQKDNRHKYEYYMRERSKSFYKQQFKSMDSVGNDETSSRYSSPPNDKDCDDSTSDELHKGKLFPTIKEMGTPNMGRASKQSSQSKQIVTLENVRHRKHKIPGIGNYHMIASPDSDFEITPAGFDSRYNRPIISNEEMEIPPRFIRERSIQKCKNWLKRNISLSPLSLQPVKKS